VLDESGYTAMLQADKSPEAPGRLENLKELINAMEAFENLSGFLEHVSLVMENAEANPHDMVSIMTLHSAKGLEFDCVFLPGWEEGVFPNQRALDATGASGLEEERRLAYVGLTRARRRAFISYAANRRIHGSWQSAVPSRFVAELPRDHIEELNALGLHGRAAAEGAFGSATVAPEGFRWRGRNGGASAAGRLIEGTAVRLTGESTQGYRAGDRIFHQKFGYGTVSVAEGDKLDIAFDKAGAKKVMAAFVVAADRAS
jgi:ATP-dependent DNA helicase UvrD/PcrA